MLQHFLNNIETFLKEHSLSKIIAYGAEMFQKIFQNNFQGFHKSIILTCKSKEENHKLKQGEKSFHQWRKIRYHRIRRRQVLMKDDDGTARSVHYLKQQ